MSSTMNSSPLHKTDQIKELKKTLSTRVQSFFQCLTAEQWGLLKSCTPDESTKLQMSELLLQIVNILSNVILTEIQPNLGNLVTDTFRSVLNINDNVQCENADNLLKLINEEVADRVSHGASVVRARPKRLHLMVMHTTQMMKNFLGRVGKVVRSVKNRRTHDQVVEMEMVELSYMKMFRRESDELYEPLTEKDTIDLSEDTANRTEGGEQRSILESEPTKQLDKEVFVQVVIEKLFSRIFNKAHGRNIKENKNILLRLIDRSWAELKDVNFEATVKNLANFDKIIHTNMCKQLGSAEQVLLSLQKEDDVIINAIKSVFKCSVVPETTAVQCICNFFSCACRGNQVGVMEDPAEVEMEIPVFEHTQEQKKEMYVEVVIEKLFSRIVKERLTCTIMKPRDILVRLHQRTLAKVEDIDFELLQINFHNLDEIIYKDLCKRLGGADQVLMSVRMEQEVIVTSIVKGFNDYLTPQPTKRPCIGKCFSSFFCRGHEDDVM